MQPGTQWMDAGGYCGSWATQRAVLAKGAWLSQQVVRDHTRGICGGHPGLGDPLVQHRPGVDEPEDRLQPIRPATRAAAADAGVLQMAEGAAGRRPARWPGCSCGLASRRGSTTSSRLRACSRPREPVIGIQSDAPAERRRCTTTTRLSPPPTPPSPLVPQDLDAALRALTVGDKAKCGLYSYGLGNPYGFGWAAKGFTPDVKSSVAAPASNVLLDPWKKEPDTRARETPEALQGTLTRRSWRPASRTTSTAGTRSARRSPTATRTRRLVHRHV